MIESRWYIVSSQARGPDGFVLSWGTQLRLVLPSIYYENVGGN